MQPKDNKKNILLGKSLTCLTKEQRNHFREVLFRCWITKIENNLTEWIVSISCPFLNFYLLNGSSILLSNLLTNLVFLISANNHNVTNKNDWLSKSKYIYPDLLSWWILYDCKTKKNLLFRQFPANNHWHQKINYLP